jgi:signal transduction histidine kinase
MGNTAMQYYIDLAAFACLMLAATALIDLWLRRKACNSGFGWRAWAAVATVVAVANVMAYSSGRAEGIRLRDTISGLAPTYAQELARMGLKQITPDTAPDDQTYLELIATEIRWLKCNPAIADVYAIGRNAQGQFVFLVDSETDYNHNGIIDDAREQRTPIGEVYEQEQELLEKAFSGQTVFSAEPITDRWGTWISTDVPVRDEAGKVYAVIGVDLPAEEYVSSILWRRAGMLGLGGMVGAILLGCMATLTTLRAEIAKREMLHRQLLDASRRAGMAETATGVLHNVGNALNSVNVSASIISEKLLGPEIAELSAATGMLLGQKHRLAEYLGQDAAGRNMPDYLALLTEGLRTQQSLVAEEVKRLSQGVDHIKEIVRAQQESARRTTIAERVSADELFEHAIVLNAATCTRHHIEVVREYEQRPALLVDKHLALQVLMNLFANAVQALKESEGRERRVTLRIRQAGAMVVFEVEDNGIGIAAENMPHLFEHGFTTRADGHGFGLHSAATTAAELHGVLKAHSQGRGCGARFTLEMPIDIGGMVQA